MTCKLHDINRHVNFVDVLQRIDTHPVSEIEKLTPRLWKEHYADNPIPAPLEQFRRQAKQNELDRAV